MYPKILNEPRAHLRHFSPPPADRCQEKEWLRWPAYNRQTHDFSVDRKVISCTRPEVLSINNLFRLITVVLNRYRFPKSVMGVAGVKFKTRKGRSSSVLSKKHFVRWTRQGYQYLRALNVWLGEGKSPKQTN